MNEAGNRCNWSECVIRTPWLWIQPSAPPHQENTRNSLIATKRSLEFWKLPIRDWNNYFVLFSPVFRCNSESYGDDRPLANEKKTAVLPKGSLLVLQTSSQQTRRNRESV